MTSLRRLQFQGLLLLAALGCRGAQFRTARHYFNGDVVSRDGERAALWAAKAAERGHTEAQVLLSYLYLLGIGVPVNLPRAFALVKGAAEAGDPDGLHSLAWCYEQGVGTAVDHHKALDLWIKAAAHGIPESQLAVAEYFFEGVHVDQDLTLADTWCRKAVANGVGERADDLMEKIQAAKITARN